MVDGDITIDIVHGDFKVTGIEVSECNFETEVHLSNDGVSPIELERRLHELLERRQEEQIEDLKAKLKNAEYKLLAKEMEIKWWKECAQKLSKTSIETTHIIGNKSNTSIAREGVSNRSLYASTSFQDKIDQEEIHLYAGESCTSKPLRMKDDRFFHIEKNIRKTSALAEDRIIMKNSKSGRNIQHADSDLEHSQLPTYGETHPLQSLHDSCVRKGKSTESEEIPSLYMRRKVSSLDKLKTDSSASHAELSKVTNVFDRSKTLAVNPCYRTPGGSYKGNKKTLLMNSKTMQGMWYNEICELTEDRRDPISPVLTKIQQWEALSRGEACALLSCDFENKLFSPRTTLASASVKDNGDGLHT